MKQSLVKKMLIKSLLPHIRLRRRYQSIVLLTTIIFSSLLEMVNIGSVMPFLAAIADPSRVYNSSIAQPVIAFLGISSANNLLIALGCFFGFITILTNGFRLLVLWGGHVSHLQLEQI